MITNHFDLPEALVRAIANDPYTKGDSDYSITQLINPPRIEALKEIHKDELEEDASNRIWSFLGQVSHVIAERSARPNIDIVEKRYFAEIEGKKISGQIDLYETDTQTLFDFKVTKAWAFSKKGGSGQKPEWIHQMNMQAHLMELNGLHPKTLQIVGILRDFDEKQAGKNGYPIASIVKAEMPLWPSQGSYLFIVKRITAHEQAKKDLPLCTKTDTWEGRRCDRWCPVNKFCIQYKEAKKTGVFVI